jgi:DNA-binding transcriptional ArsR family regulator
MNAAGPTSRGLSRRGRLAAIEALSSPIRQEVISELAEEPGTVKELSIRLGRSRQALHFHIDVLERAGLVRVDSLRGDGRAQERVYRFTPGATELRARKTLTTRERSAAAKAAKAMLRLTQREITAALSRRTFARADGYPPILAIRAKARLDPGAVRRVRELLGEITTLFRDAKGKNQDQRFTAMTVVLTPARETAANAVRSVPTRRKDQP